MAEKKDLAKLIDDRYEKASKAQLSYYDEAEQARLFFRGDQWLIYQNGWQASPPSEPWRVRLTVNKLMPMVHQLMSTVLRVRPIISVKPASDDDIDRRQARIAQSLIRYWWDELKMLVLEARKLLHLFVCGNVFYRVGWDEEKGTPSVKLVPAYSISVEPGAETFDDANWCIITELIRRGEAELRYSKKFPKSAEVDGAHPIRQRYVPVLIEGEENATEDRIVHQEMFERPSLDYPEGRHVIKVGDEIVVDEPLPLNKTVPVVHFRAIELIGELWATSPVAQAIPLQMEINRSRSQLIENRNLTARPQILAAEGAIEEDAIDNRPGSIVWWDPVLSKGNPPMYMRPPVLPGWVTSIMSIAEKDIYDLMSRHEVSQGQLGGVSSGRQAAILRQADDVRWDVTLLLNEQGLAETARLMLAFAQKHMTGEQVISIMGQSRSVEVFRFNADEMNIGSRLNVRFDIASQLPWTKESSRQQAVQLAQSGLLDKETLYNIMEFPSPENIYETAQSERLNARKENQLLDQVYFDPLPTDRHDVHIEEHRAWINRPEIRQYIVEQWQYDIQKARLAGGQPPPVPSIVANHLRHMEEHRKRLPQPEPPPPAPKVNLGVDRLIRDLVQLNPAYAERLLPYVEEILKDSLNDQTPPDQGPKNTPAGVRAPAMGAVNPPAGPAVPYAQETEEEILGPGGGMQ